MMLSSVTRINNKCTPRITYRCNVRTVGCQQLPLGRGILSSTQSQSQGTHPYQHYRFGGGRITKNTVQAFPMPKTRFRFTNNSSTIRPFSINSFKHIMASHKQKDHNKTLQELSKSLEFMFSDLNLRNYERARSIIAQYGNQYLPMDHIMSVETVKRFTTDPDMVVEAIDIANQNLSTQEVQLHVETINGETVVRRTPAFSYIESIRNSHRKMMVVEGWPKHIKETSRRRNVLSVLRTLLRTDMSIIDNGNVREIPRLYWRFDHVRGGFDIEFESNEGAMVIWNNLERAATSQESTINGTDFEVRNLSPDNHNRSYQIRVGDMSLLVRSIDVTRIEEESLREPENMITDDEQKSSTSSDTQLDRTLQEVSSPPDKSHARRERHNDGHSNVRDKTLQELSQSLGFIFSDLNLRNYKRARSIFAQYGNQYLPMKHLMHGKTVTKFTTDPDMVVEAIDIVNSSTQEVQLHIETINGETVVRRTPAFSYIESIRNSHEKMMVVEGWPNQIRKRNVMSMLHTLLRTDLSSTDNGNVREIPRLYWRFDHPRGVIHIEYESNEGAMVIWHNLERAATSQELTIDGMDIEVRNLLPDNENRSYEICVGNMTLLVRSIGLTRIEEESLREPENMITNDEQQSTDSTVEQKSSASDTQLERNSQEVSLSLDKSHTRYERWDGKRTPSLSQFSHAMNQLYQEHIAMPPPSREWLNEYTRPRKRARHQSNNDETSELQEQLIAQRQDLCRDVRNLVSSVKASIEQGKIRALGSKDGYDLTDSLGRAMSIYSETPSPSAAKDNTTDGIVSPYQACMDAFGILRSLNLDTHPTHFSYAIRAACHESRWDEASKLFLAQIDGDATGNHDFMATGGFVPIDPKLGWDQPLEMGLYAVAQDSLQKRVAEGGGETRDLSPSKRVFDTAMKMCMISPSCQENYILAAGSALGRAGLWRDCLEFATVPDSISTYGPSIAAAAMQACIGCSRFVEAIDAYDMFMSGNQSAASEWQWGGGNITAVKPLCRDFLLHAMGNLDRGGFGQDAMHMFGEIIHEDNPLSTNALLGVARSMEHDGDWKSSIQLLRQFLQKVYLKKSPRWRIFSDPLNVNKHDNASDEETINHVGQNNLLISILASVMRVCNREGHHGLAILMCSIVNNCYVIDQNMKDHDRVEFEDSDTVKAILSQKIVSEYPIFEVYIQSLHGLGCGSIVTAFLNNSHVGGNVDISMPRGRIRKDLLHAESWINAFVAMCRVIEAMDAIELEGSAISSEDRLLFERGLARAMEHCIDANQPAAALYLFDHASTILDRKDTTLAEKVKTFFGMEDSSSNKTAADAIFEKDSAVDLKNIRLSDPLLAAVIKANYKLGQPEAARTAFIDGTHQMDGSALMTQSTNDALEVLLETNIDDSMSFLDEMNAKCVNPSTFSVIARHYARDSMWPEIGKLYNKARSAGCTSEDLGVIAMQAVAESDVLDKKIVILRRIVEDVSSLVGMKSNDWLHSRYWSVKEYVGFHYARLLMRWNDPATSQKEELLFAVKEMRRCSSEGIVVKNKPLMCIVKISRLYSTDGRIDDGVISEQQRLSAVNLILEACKEAIRSGLIKNHTFTAEVARSLRALKANKECIQVVRKLTSGGDKCWHRKAMEEGIYAALEESDHQSFHSIMDAFEQSGYDSRRLSI